MFDIKDSVEDDEFYCEKEMIGSGEVDFLSFIFVAYVFLMEFFICVGCFKYIFQIVLAVDYF